MQPFDKRDGPRATQARRHPLRLRRAAAHAASPFRS